MQLAPAFNDPVFASQSVFRAAMDAMARPGMQATVRPQIAAPEPLCPAMAALALALLDFETPVWLDAPLSTRPEVGAWLAFHTGAAVTPDPKLATFALVASPHDAPAFDAFSLGTPDYPDRSATVVLQVESFSGGDPLTLSGPGIAGTRSFSASPLPPDFRARLHANRRLFPRGIDLFIACNDALVALPRSVRVGGGGN